MKYLAFPTELAAIARDAANLHATEEARALRVGRQSMWKPELVDAVEGYPAGVWPGEPIGGGRKPNPIGGIATASYPVRRRKTTREYLARDETGIEVPERALEPLDEAGAPV